MALTRRKFLVFAVVAATLSFGVLLAALLAADLYLHHRAERSAGLNRSGYRGPVAGRKKSGELRVVMLGGSTVFGYGVPWEQAIPAALERRLTARASRPVSVVNLGFNNEGAHAFVPNLTDFAYLDYDVICLYEGYNDLPGDEGPNTAVYRRESPVFGLTGYLPILPLYLDEKAMMLRHGGDLSSGYAAARGQAGPTVFRPNLAQRTSAEALDALAAVTSSLANQLDRISTAEKPTLATESRLGCAFPWVNYCESVHAAVTFALANGRAVVVASQPRLAGPSREVHARQQAMLAAMLVRHFSGNPRVVWADLSGAVDLTNPDVTFDAMHLNEAGNQIVAEALVAPVLAVSNEGVEPRR